MESTGLEGVELSGQTVSNSVFLIRERNSGPDALLSGWRGGASKSDAMQKPFK